MDYLSKYVKIYTAGTESPKEFHIWTALSTIASVVGRKVWLDQGFFKIYPNMYIILVAPPGKARKSTALKRGRNLLKQVDGIHFSSDSITVEALYKDMEESVEPYYVTTQQIYFHRSYTAHISELKMMLQANDKKMVSFLTDIYDCGNPDVWEYKTKHQGTNVIEHPFFNMLAATTPGDVSDIFNEKAVAGGLTSRIIFVYSENVGKRVAFGVYTDEQKQAEKELVRHLVTLQDCYGEFQITPEAKKKTEEWYENYITPTEDTRIVGYYERKLTHVLKIAMNASLARDRKLVIEEVDVDFAMGQLDVIEPTLIHVYSGVGGNDQLQVMNLIKRLLRHGPRTEEEILMETFFTSPQENTMDVLKFMTTTRQITKETHTDIKTAYVKTTYSLRKNPLLGDVAE